MTDGERAPGAGSAQAAGRSVFSRVRFTGAMIVVGIGLVGAIFYATINNHYLGTILGQTLGPYSDALAEHGFEQGSPELWGRMAARHHVVLLVEPASGEPFGYGADGELLSPAQAQNVGGVRTTRTASDGSRVTLYWTFLAFREAHLPLLGGLLVMIAAVVGAAFWFLHRQLKPLEAVRQGVEAVSRGNFAPRVPVARADEIGQVAEAFNAMAGRVGEMIDDRERLLGDVSHELRSPIARMKVALELMPESAKRESVARDLREMEGLISVLLEREVLRSAPARFETEPVDLAGLARRVAESFDGRAPGLVVTPEEAVSAQADPALMRLLIHNLVDNAVKFSLPDSGPVELSLEAEGDGVLLRVIDDGAGIPEGREEEVFEPFVKLDTARGHRAGYGIGLDLCQRIVQLHGGELRLIGRQPRGTEARVVLPQSG